MLRLIKYFLLSLVLLLVFLGSALLAMRFAIHGREVRVPNFTGLTPLESERQANAQGLVVAIENRFYSADVPAGHIVSQAPEPYTQVRRGWKVRVAESLGPQRATIPNLVGESQRVAEVNISRRGLEIGSVATIHLPGEQPAMVIAQTPAPGARNAISPKIGLLVSAPDNGQSYVMPNLVGQPLAGSAAMIQQAGFTLGKVGFVEIAGTSSGTIVQQFPAAGEKIAAGATITLQVVR